MDSSRERQYDLLRLICVFAVMMIHTAGIYVGRVGIYSFSHMPSLAVMDTATTFAVPVFVMLSGAFTLGNDSNLRAADYYRKIWKKLGIPALIFSVFYTVASIPLAYFGTTQSDILDVLKNSLCGLPFYHMWYVYMMIGVYAAAPLLTYLRHEISEKSFSRVSAVLFVVCGFSLYTRPHSVQWDIGYSAGFLGYFAVGYVLRKKAEKRKGNIRGLLFIAVGVLILAGQSYLRWKQLTGDLSEEYILTGSASPGIMAASLFLFYGFGCLRVTFSIKELIRDSYLMYLIHGGTLSLITGVIYLIGKTEMLLSSDLRISIPLITLAVFLLSWVFARILRAVFP